MTDTFYDAAGRIYQANSAYYNSNPIDRSTTRSKARSARMCPARPERSTTP